jgi:hypothetical protein
MKAKKEQTPRRKPDRTFNVTQPLVEFRDKPRGKLKPSSGVVTSYDPELIAALMRPKNGSAKPGRRSDHAEAETIENLARLLDECLQTASTIKTKQATELVKKLRNARRQVELIHTNA